MRFASLGSGSKGNGTLVDDGDTCLLVDLGFSLAETRRRLARLQVDPAAISGILVTHEHADHIHGVAAFARAYDTPVYLTHGTYDERRMGALGHINRISGHQRFSIGSMEVSPVPVPHDAREPCQYVVRGGGQAIGILTDLGHVTPHVAEHYAACDALLLEFNHDWQMLQDGPYPRPLKERVGGDYGHLNNEQAAGLLRSVDLARLRYLVISHVSQQNNHPQLAVEAVTAQLGGWGGELTVSDQDLGFDWKTLADFPIPG